MDSEPRRFDANYRESFQAAGGEFITFRLIRPHDKSKLLQGIARLSENSRYYRFLRPKSRLTEAELRYLTELDLDNHLAIVVAIDDVGGERGLGVARFIRLKEEPTVAEAAIVVADAAQRMGIGKRLLQRLSEAAAERGIETFVCEYLSHNTGFKELMERVFDDPKNEVIGDGVVRTRVSVPGHANLR